MAEQQITFRIAAVDEASGRMRAIAAEAAKTSRDNAAESTKAFKAIGAGLDALIEKENALKQSREAAERVARATVPFKSMVAEIEREVAAERKLAQARQASRSSGASSRAAGGGASGAGGSAAPAPSSGGATPEGEQEKGGVLDQLKSGFGRGSTITQLGKIAKGSGAVIGLTLIGRELNAFVEKLQEVDKLTRGQIKPAWQEVVANIGEGLPILGGFVSAGQRIRELFTGEQAAIDAINKDSELTNEYVDARLAGLKQEKETYFEIEKSIRAIRDHSERIGFHGFAAQLVGIKQAAKADQTDIPQELQKQVSAVKSDARSKLIEKLRTEANQIAPDVGFGTRLIAGASYIPHTKDSGIAQAERDVAASEKDAQDRAAKLRKQANTLAGDRDRELEELKKKYGVKEVAAAEDHAKDFAQTREESKLVREKDAREAEARIAQIKSKSQEDQLRTSGAAYAADLLALRQKLKEENDAVEEAMRVRRRDIEEGRKAGDFGEGAEGDEKAAAELSATEDRAARERAASKTRFDEGGARAAETDAKAQLRIQDQLARARIADIEAEVAAGNKSLEQDRARLELAERFNARRRELKDLAENERAGPASRAQANAELGKLDAQERQAQAARTNNALQEAGLRALEGQASTGSRFAKIQLDQFAVRKKFVEEEARLRGLLADEKASGAEKAQAQQILGVLPDQFARELANVIRQNVPRPEPLAANEQNAGGGITGVAAEAREAALSREIVDPMAQRQDRANELLAGILKNTERQQAAAAGIPAGGPISAHNTGGIVPGSGPNRDSVIIAATPGEMVVQRPAVEHYGAAALEAINRMAVPKFNAGGKVPPSYGGLIPPQSALAGGLAADAKDQVRRLRERYGLPAESNPSPTFSYHAYVTPAEQLQQMRERYGLAPAPARQSPAEQLAAARERYGLQAVASAPIVPAAGPEASASRPDVPTEPPRLADGGPTLPRARGPSLVADTEREIRERYGLISASESAEAQAVPRPPRGPDAVQGLDSTLPVRPPLAAAPPATPLATTGRDFAAERKSLSAEHAQRVRALHKAHHSSEAEDRGYARASVSLGAQERLAHRGLDPTLPVRPSDAPPALAGQDQPPPRPPVVAATQPAPVAAQDAQSASASRGGGTSGIEAKLGQILEQLKVMQRDANSPAVNQPLFGR